jgi:flagellar basal-body rod protein FlgC
MFGDLNSFFSAMDVSTTGLIVQRYRMNVASENLANIETTKVGDGSPYRRKQVVITAAGSDRQFLNMLMGASVSTPVVGGVRISGVVEDPTPFRKVHKPGHPDADENGYVAMPNVNAILEMADILSATRAYEANITAFSAAKSMISKALDLAK